MGNEIFIELNKEEYPEVVKERVNKVINIVRPYTSGVIADIGCGNCYVGESLGASYFFDYYAAKIPECNILHVNLEALYIDSKDKRFNTILLFHVLEHFNNVPEIIKFLYNYLCDGGKLIIAVPVGDYDNGYEPYNTGIGHNTKFTVYNAYDLLVHKTKFNIEFFITVEHKNNFHEYVFVLKKY